MVTGLLAGAWPRPRPGGPGAPETVHARHPRCRRPDHPQPRHRPLPADPSHRGRRRRTRAPRRRVRPVRPPRGEGAPRRARPCGRAAAGQVRRRDGHHAHAARRGQDGDGDRARAGAAVCRQAGGHVPARALPGPGVRDQGRGRGRRARAGGAARGRQPPLHRRHPCGGRGAQPAGGVARQPPALRQRAGRRPGERAVAARPRRLRPRAAARRRGAGAGPRGAAARDRVRHHRRQRGDGDPGPRHQPRGPARATWPHRGRRHARRAAGHRRGSAGRRRDGGAPARGAAAEPRAEPRGRAGAGAHGPVRQHRARQQLGGRRPDRGGPRRLRDHRVGLRRRPGGGEVHGHQVPRVGAHAPLRGAGGVGARVEGPLRAFRARAPSSRPTRRASTPWSATPRSRRGRWRP